MAASQRGFSAWRLREWRSRNGGGFRNSGGTIGGFRMAVLASATTVNARAMSKPMALSPASPHQRRQLGLRCWWCSHAVLKLELPTTATAQPQRPPSPLPLECWAHSLERVGEPLCVGTEYFTLSGMPVRGMPIAFYDGRTA